MALLNSAVRNFVCYHLVWRWSVMPTDKTTVISLDHTRCLFQCKEWLKLWWNVSSQFYPQNENIHTVSDWIKHFSSDISYYTIFILGQQHCTSVSVQSVERFAESFYFSSQIFAYLLLWIQWLLDKLRSRYIFVTILLFIHMYWHF